MVTLLHQAVVFALLLLRAELAQVSCGARHPLSER